MCCVSCWALKTKVDFVNPALPGRKAYKLWRGKQGRIQWDIQIWVCEMPGNCMLRYQESIPCKLSCHWVRIAVDKNSPPKFWLYIAEYLHHERGKCLVSCFYKWERAPLHLQSSFTSFCCFGEWCAFPVSANFYHKTMQKPRKFLLPSFLDCFWVQEIRIVLSFSQALWCELPHTAAAAVLQSPRDAPPPGLPHGRLRVLLSAGKDGGYRLSICWPA